MSLDQVVEELAALLERNQDMPFAQYTVRLPDRGGMYHLTLTPPGRTPPQETVVVLEKEREGLRSQVAALQPLATNVEALGDVVRQQVAVLSDSNAALGVTMATQTEAVTQSSLDSRALVKEVRVLAGDMAMLPDQIMQRFNVAMVKVEQSAGETAMQLLKQMDIVLQRAQDLQSFMGDMTALMRKVDKTNNGLPSVVEESLREEYATTIAPVVQSLTSTFSAYEQALQDWAIEARSEFQRNHVDLLTSVEETLGNVKQVAAIIEGLGDHVAEETLIQAEQTTAAVRVAVAGTIDRVAALQQDIMRHVVGATEASRDGTSSVLARIDDARVDIAKYLTTDVVDATKAMQDAAGRLLSQDDLVTRIFALESEVERQAAVLDAAERLVHSVREVPADLMSPQLRDLRNTLREEGS